MMTIVSPLGHQVFRHKVSIGQDIINTYIQLGHTGWIVIVLTTYLHHYVVYKHKLH